MEVDGPLIIHGGNGRICHMHRFLDWVSVILDLGLGWMNLNHFTEKPHSPTSVANLFKTCSPGSGGYGEAKELERLIWLF